MDEYDNCDISAHTDYGVAYGYVNEDGDTVEEYYCRTCSDGYTWNFEDWECQTCSTVYENCNECTGDGKCLSCDSGYFLSQDGSRCIAHYEGCAQDWTEYEVAHIEFGLGDEVYDFNEYTCGQCLPGYYFTFKFVKVEEVPPRRDLEEDEYEIVFGCFGECSDVNNECIDCDVNYNGDLYCKDCGYEFMPSVDAQ